MNPSELRRLIRHELEEGRELKRSDDDIAGRIVDVLADAGALKQQGDGEG